ncbi:MAG: AAA family ATPase [Deltaproteobacteria bacterium]|nr:AAA family ATPase [Deltaproteobacteria bacterium]
MKIISISSAKGGVGKSTLAINLALSMKGKILVCDFDSQASLTDYFLRDTPLDDFINKTSYHFLTGKESAESCILKSDNDSIYIIPASLDLIKIGIEMASDPMGVIRARKRLQALKYDYIIIDTPPGIGFSMRAGLYCSDIILTPIQFDRWTVQGLSMLAEEVEAISEARTAPEIIAVPYMTTEKESIQLQDALSESFNVSKSFIGRKLPIRTAVNKGIPVKDSIKESFQNLSKEIA